MPALIDQCDSIGFTVRHYLRVLCSRCPQLVNSSRTEGAANELVAQLQGILIYPYSRRMIRGVILVWRPDQRISPRLHFLVYFVRIGHQGLGQEALGRERLGDGELHCRILGPELLAEEVWLEHRQVSPRLASASCCFRA